MKQSQWVRLILSACLFGFLVACGDKDKSPPDDGDKAKVHALAYTSEFCGVQLDPKCLQDILRSTDPFVCRTADEVLSLVETLCE